MKRIIAYALMICMMLSALSVYAEQSDIPISQPFKDIWGIENITDIDRGVIVLYDGKCADIESDDLYEWLNVYWNFSHYERVVAPLDSYFLDDYYVKLWDKNGTSYIVYANSGVIVGGYGEECESHGETKKNYIWYLPYIGNARNALYTANTKLFMKYLNEKSDEFKGVLRDTGKEDAITIPKENLLDTDNASVWAKPEIQKAASCNLMVYDLSSKYTDAITRKEFCYLVYRLIATEFSPDSDSRMGEWLVTDKVIDERGIREKYNSAVYTDIEDEKVKFLSAADIINGMGDGTFSPDSSLTREQAATILCRTAKFLRNKTIPKLQDRVYYNDENLISTWALENVKTISEMKIMEGIGEYEFSPQGTYTVEQAIATMLRLYECY